LNSRINDPSHWLTSERVQGYLERADKISHRSEGENVLLDFIPNTTRKVLDLGTGDGRLIKILKRKIPLGKYVAIDFSPPMLKTLKRRFGRDNSVCIIQHSLESHLPGVGYFDAVIQPSYTSLKARTQKNSLFRNLFHNKIWWYIL
jgi:tRNA (cmo5U34)-methyltransferase